ncbi:hypothetical protein N8D56_21150 [Devosia sp. A8/3-2]|nr:hypothetical protein N8D56_21150 [Devosia sp. A8/3-2]
MSEMVERVERAIAVDALRQNPMLEIMDGGLGYYDDYDNKAYDCVEIARAAIVAMRDPTYRMTVAGHSALDDTEHTQAKALGSLMGRMAFVDVWQAMVDAALPAPPSEE